MKVSKNFVIQEFIPQEVFIVHGANSVRFIRKGIIETAQQLRDVFGVMKINDWYFGGRRNWSGYRNSLAENIYSQTSAHSFGDAIDCRFNKVTAEEARQYILSNQDKFPYITRIEKKVGWLHVDGLYTGVKEIVLFEPPIRAKVIKG